MPAINSQGTVMGRRERTPACTRRARRVAARQNRPREDGAAAVEFALVVPFLAMLLLGTVTIGLAYSNHVALTNAVREGARLGASAPADANWGASVVTQTTTVYADDNNPLTSANVCAQMIKYDGSGTVVTSSATSQLGSGCSSSTAPPTPAGTKSACVVKVWALQPSTINWLLGGATVTLKAQSVELYLRGASC